jgi:hypothetical protein
MIILIVTICSKFPSFHAFCISELSFCTQCHDHAAFYTVTLRLALLVPIIRDVMGSNVDPQSFWNTFVTICTTCFVDSNAVNFTQRLVVCSVRFSYKATIISVNGINRLVFVIETHWFCVLLDVITILGTGNSFLGIKQAKHETDHFNLASRLRMSIAVTILLVYAFMANAVITSHVCFF